MRVLGREVRLSAGTCLIRKMAPFGSTILLVKTAMGEDGIMVSLQGWALSPRQHQCAVFLRINCPLYCTTLKYLFLLNDFLLTHIYDLKFSTFI